MRWDVVLERKTKNRLNEDITRKKLKAIAAAAERNHTFGFVARVGKLGEPVLVHEDGGEMHRYLVRLRLEKGHVRKAEEAQNQYRHVLGVVKRCAESQGWKILTTDLNPLVIEDGASLFAVPGDTRPLFEVPPLTDGVMTEFFGGIYERDEHIRVIHDAVVHHVATLAAWRADETVEVARSHLLLKGKPAGAKTALFERFKRWYEAASPGAARLTFIDTHTATKAGIENWLLDLAEAGELADIVIFEELEKLQPLDHLLPLVSVMGSGHIAKLNARVGHRRQLANILVMATCNDEGLLRRWRNGAIWSRFSKKLHCPRPSRALMKRILLDTIERTGGNPDWADMALQFAYEVAPMVLGRPVDDPREIKGLLDGRDRLLDGSYQQDLLTIMRAEVDEVRADHQPGVGT